MSYRYATGHGVALVSLTVLTTALRHNPTSPGVQHPARVYAISDAEFFDGQPFCVWTWPAMSYADFTTLRTGLGLSFTVAYALVTIYTLKELDTYARYNATAHVSWTEDGYTKGQGAIRDVVVRFTGLVAL
jgi:hypothetical protein